ncbi:MAG TPA: DUF1992 domain-containing protein [Vicinamibacterales bacterium]|nr:DUF1992 domain-containing protein [Vicinamibacterales bacterium]
MAFERIAEQEIQDAMARGEFDNLPNAGQPIDLEEYFRTPEPLRMAYSILKSAKCAPEEVELLKEIRSLERSVAAVGDEPERARLAARLRNRRLQLAVALDRQRLRSR